MLNSSLYKKLFFLFLILIVLSEPALANKFTTIGGGVSGSNSDKYRGLQMAAGGFGVFFVLLGALAMVPKLRGFSELKVPEVTLGTSIFLMVFGIMLIGLYLI